MSRSLTLKQYIKRFLCQCEYRGLSPKTITRHVCNFNDFTLWLGRKQITKETLRTFIIYSQQRKARTNNGLSLENGLKPYSINSLISTLKLFTRFLYNEEGFLKKDLSTTIRSVKPQPFFPNLLTIHEVKALIECQPLLN